MKQIKTKSSQVPKFVLENLFRLPVFWIFFVFFGWIMSFFWLGGDALWPYVLISWFSGFGFLFGDFFPNFDFYTRFEGFYEVILEFLFIIFLFRVGKMPKKLLYWLAFFFIIIFILSLVGCSLMDYSYLHR